MLQELYRELILDHSKSPKNFYLMPNPTHSAFGNNPLCGDEIKVFLISKAKFINKISFIGESCAICKASASLLTEHVMGYHVDKIPGIFQMVHKMLTSDYENESLGKLQVLSGVRRYPVRVKCATLPWHTLNAAIKNNIKIISTE